MSPVSEMFVLSSQTKADDLLSESKVLQIFLAIRKSPSQVHLAL